MLDLSSNTIFFGVFLLVVLGSLGLFVVDGGSTSPDPVSFDETVTIGLTLEDERALETGLDAAVELPRTQVFYSQYQYVVGYYGVETFVETQRQAAHEQRFGHPLTIYVSDYSDTDLTLTDEGYPVTDRPAGWTEAETAWFVVGSDARLPAGETVVSFADRADAQAFADSYGGTVSDWEGVLDEPFETDDAAVARDRVDDHHRLADDRIDATETHTDRPTSVVVGTEADTVQEAVDRAPANTTVVVPDGVYEEHVEIDRPITLAGDGDVTLRGNTTGTVLTVTSDRVAVQDIAIDGVGETTRGDGEIPVSVDDEEWDAAFRDHYAGTDAGVGAFLAEELLIQNVTIDTPASGVLAYGSQDAVVRNVTVDAPDDQTDGLAGVLLFQSPGVVESTTVTGGSNGVYFYRSPETVVRSNTIEGNRLGIHAMHTDDSLIADNELRNGQFAGVYIMTGPERNAIVGNTVEDAEMGFSIGGSESYVAENLANRNDVGLSIGTTTSIYEGNAFTGNEIGVDVTAMLPTNQVIGNDFVGNDEHAATTAGPLRIWSDETGGNYWQGGARVAAGDAADRSYSPTDAVDSRLHLTDGTPTLVRSPARLALTGLEGAVPGMQTASIVDRAPTCEPTNPELLDRTDWGEHAWPCYDTTDEER